MRTFSNISKILSIAMCMSIAMPVFAESAPVYDADTMQQQFENSLDQAQDLPSPPPPGQEGAYVPSQPDQQAPNIVVNNSSSLAPLSMEQRVKRVEQQINNMQNGDAAARTESMQNQIQSLRAQVEQLTHQIQQLQNQQKSMYSDLDKRLSQQNVAHKSVGKPSIADTRETTNASDDAPVASSKPSRKLTSLKPVAETPDTVVADTETTKPTADQPNVAEEQQIYQTAYNFIKAKKYDDAVTALQKMLQKYPSGQFASNAHYWLGELYGLLGKNDQSLTEFNTVVKNFPDSPRVSDAQLKVGLIYATQSKWAEAKTAFKKVINHYPGTASSRLASEQLKQIKQAGH